MTSDLQARLEQALSDVASLRSENFGLCEARRAGMELLDALALPAGRDLQHAWDEACLLLGRFDWSGHPPALLRELLALRRVRKGAEPFLRWVKNGLSKTHRPSLEEFDLLLNACAEADKARTP